MGAERAGLPIIPSGEMNVVKPRLSSEPGSPATHVKDLLHDFGQNKSMEKPRVSGEHVEPKFSLLRKFKGENDLLIIFDTKRCAFQCAFCRLPNNSSKEYVHGEDIIKQFRSVVDMHAPALSILDKFTLSNDGSIFDEKTFPADALTEIVTAIGTIREVKRVDLETRLEFVTAERINELNGLLPHAQIGILTGFETVDERTRDEVLDKRESLAQFTAGLDNLPPGAPLTAYVLVKPNPKMSDEEAIEEAKRSITYLYEETSKRDLPLTIRLNPMYKAAGSLWEGLADTNPEEYQPPRLTDVLTVAKEAVELGIPTYIGLSTEDRVGKGTYRDREDFDNRLMEQAIVFNHSEQEIPVRRSDVPGMTPVKLKELEDAGFARVIEVDGRSEIEFTISPQWPDENETWIGEASDSRLVECIRQLHWEHDVEPFAHGEKLDCSTKISNGEFNLPVTVGKKVIGSYRVLDVGDTSYTMGFFFRSPEGKIMASFEKIFVFCDPDNRKPTDPPPDVKENLERLSIRDAKAK